MSPSADVPTSAALIGHAGRTRISYNDRSIYSKQKGGESNSTDRTVGAPGLDCRAVDDGMCLRQQSSTSNTNQGFNGIQTTHGGRARSAAVALRQSRLPQWSGLS